MNDNNIVYQARLHWVIFVWPVVFFTFVFYLAVTYQQFREASLIMCGIGLIWAAVVMASYRFSLLIIKNKQIIIQTGFLVRQTYDIPLNRIESIDIKQPIIGSILRYGSLEITGTGGTRQFINYISKPLTCRRYIEQLMHQQ